MRSSLGRGKREIESQLLVRGGEQQVWVVEPGVGSEFNTVDCILNPVDRKEGEVFPGPRPGRIRQRQEPGSRDLNTTLYKSCLVELRVDHLPYAFFRSVNTGIMHDTGVT